MAIRAFQGKLPQCDESVFVDYAAVVIGDVVIGADSSVWPMAVIRGDVHHIRIGKRTSVQDGAVLHVTHDGPYSPGGAPLIIGNDVTIGHNATLHACTVEDCCLIGMNVTILDKAHVESGVMIGAGSLVPPGKRLLSGYLYRGVPVQQARPLTEKEQAFLAYSAENYVKLKNTYLEQAHGDFHDHR